MASTPPQDTPARHSNRVRAVRTERGLAQLELAARVGLTRQSLSAIEACRVTPGVDVALRLANALGCAVEELFGGATPPTTLSAVEVSALPVGARALVARVDGRWVAHSLASDGLRTPADGIVQTRRQRTVAIEAVRTQRELEENVVVLGCATALGLLAERLNGAVGRGHFSWLPCASTRAVEALAAGHAHLAGVHLVDAKTGESNVGDVRRLAKDLDVSLVTLAHWEVGFVTSAGNPKQFRTASDLGRRGLRIVRREAGSGVHRLLERELRRAGVAKASTQGDSIVASGHVEVARMIAIGAADLGVATRDVAIACGLGFVPLAEERYDLVVPRASLDEPRIARLLEMLVSAPYRRELDALGYDTRPAGDRVADLHAA